MICFGDSLTHGYGASVQANAWVDLLKPVNVGVPAAQAADVSINVHQFQPWALVPYTILVGSNDVARYRDNTAKQAFYGRCLRSILAWLAHPDKCIPRLAQGTILASGGTWSNAPAPNGTAIHTTDGYAYQTARVAGSRVTVGLVEGDMPQLSSAVRVLVDGVIVAEQPVLVPGVTTFLGATWGNTAWSFGGLSDGPHDVTVQNLDPGKTLHLNYIAGSNQIVTPKILVGTVPRYSDAAYVWSDTTLAMTQALNSIVASVVDEFDALDVQLVDTFAAVVPSLHLTPDGVHTNDAGHAAIALAYRQKLAA